MGCFGDSQMNLFFRALGACTLACVFSGPLHAVSEVPHGKSEVLTGSVQHERLFELDREGDRIVTVGDRGLVLRSEDAGKTWVRDNLPDPVAMLGVAIVGDRTVAVGQMGLIYVHSPESGWKKVESPTQERLLNVAGNNSGRVVAVGAFGAVIMSNDYGDTWTNAQPNWLEIGDADAGGGALTGAAGEPTIYAVQVFDDGTIFIGGELSFIVRSKCGKNWQLVNQAKTSLDEIAPSINSISIRPNGIGFAVGQSGTVLRTRDRGASWEVLDSSATANLLSVTSLDSGEVVAVGMRSTIRSNDGGDSWSSMRSLDFPINWYSGVMSDAASGEILAVGHSARVVRVRPD